MREKKMKTEYSQAATYQTGSTRPPKSYKGVIAFLLGLVIILCGVVTILSLLNIRLFRQLNNQAEEPQAVAFSHEADARSGNARQTPLGFSGETITDFWHTYHGLPRGVFIQSVEPDSDAARHGILTGDILISVNGEPVVGMDELEALLRQCHPGEKVRAGIRREDRYYECLLTLDERN